MKILKQIQTFNLTKEKLIEIIKLQTNKKNDSIFRLKKTLCSKISNNSLTLFYSPGRHFTSPTLTAEIIQKNEQETEVKYYFIPHYSDILNLVMYGLVFYIAENTEISQLSWIVTAIFIIDTLFIFKRGFKLKTFLQNLSPSRN